MKRILSCAALVAALATAPCLAGQAASDTRTFNHGEVGIYGDLFRVKPATAPEVNFLGLGGRVGLNVHPHVALEAELNYDFEKNYTNVNVNGSTGTGSSTTVVSKLRPLTGLFGPKFQFGTSGPFRAFVVAKAGFVEFSYSDNSPSGTTFTSAVNQFGGGSTHFAGYPGGGIEFFAGPFGLRVEAGDELYYTDSVYNNLRVTFGPTLRF